MFDRFFARSGVRHPWVGWRRRRLHRRGLRWKRRGNGRVRCRFGDGGRRLGFRFGYGGQTSGEFGEGRELGRIRRFQCEELVGELLQPIGLVEKRPVRVQQADLLACRFGAANGFFDLLIEEVHPVLGLVEI
jgi:hypothetical protein